VEIEYISGGKEDTALSPLKKRRLTAAAPALRTITVEVAEPLAGRVTRLPRRIRDVCDKESESQTVCGAVLNLQKKKTKNGDKTFFTFRLNDGTGIMPAVYFPRTPNTEGAFELNVKEGIEIVAEGAVRMDNYSGAFTLSVQRAAMCAIDKESVRIGDETQYLDVPEEYAAVTPLPYEERGKTQANMFEVTDDYAGDGNVYVVFDFETTGLSPTQDRVIEIGAAKIENGRITETFSTLVNPEIPIPAKASDVNHIYDKDVKHSPLWEDVVGDFYKFCHNAILVAHNASFDTGFLYEQGKACRYDFQTRPVRDTLELARKKWRFKSNKLTDICKELGVSVENAHRALDDAVATAKVFLEIIKDKI
jgi:DNA polymerase III epsilon subunit family exonuclease